jgi:hypothetical protein
MNDNELITAVRESVADIHSATPVAQIINRGRAVRARRRIPEVAGALAVAAGTALAVTVLLPSGRPGLASSGQPGLASSGHPGSHPASAQLAAWTVAKLADGDIDVTINQLQNPAGLQSTLRADGLPVNVTFSGPSLTLSGPSPSASCQPYAGSGDVLSSVAHWNTRDGSAFLVIDPSALPSGTGLGIFDEPGAGTPKPSPGTPTLGSGRPARITGPPVGITGPLAVGLVYASQQCTG